jgi:FkbM family methyltransferase
MIRAIKIALKKSIVSVFTGINNTNAGKSVFREILKLSMEKVGETTHNGVQLKFAVPNALCEWRVETYSSKEPETLEWIDSIPADAVLWDIGANIGLYSVYAAKKRGCSVYAFEPSVFNLELLARNIYLNGLSNKVCIVPLALSDQMSLSAMRMTSTDWGGALSTFGKEFGWDGKTINQTFEYRMIGVSMEDVVNKLNIPLPDYIKMDVDGLEHFILKGGASVLSQIKEIIIEVNDDFIEQAEQCHSLLKKAELTLKEKRHSDIIAASTVGFQNSYNQIWVKA